MTGWGGGADRETVKQIKSKGTELRRTARAHKKKNAQIPRPGCVAEIRVG